MHGHSPFSGNSESNSAELGTVSCPSIFRSLFASFLFYTYFLLICLKKIIFSCTFVLLLFFPGFLFFFLVSHSFCHHFPHSLSVLLFSPGLCVCVCFPVFWALSQFFRLSHLPNFFHAEMGGDGGSHRVPLATSWKLMVVTGCPLEKAGRAA